MIAANARVAEMSRESLSSTTVPYGADQTLYLVIDRLSGTREMRVERTELEATIHDLIAGCFSDPVRVTCFNTLEHWARDISAEIAAEIQSRCDIDGVELPDHLRDFVECHICAARRPERVLGLSPPSGDRLDLAAAVAGK
jgi:hypothetical protein